ncbi:hypothetical protein [Novipirellula rosea]|uniref:Uncharacterized protein n=1 Tax=Novipirellula rosea TaxID=1031540 RepID=A0ABP8MA79_9BACT
MPLFEPPIQRSRRYTAGANTLADQLAANPFRPQPSPLQQAMTGRRQQLAGSLQQSQTSLVNQANAAQNVHGNYATMAENQANNLHNRMAQATSLGQRLGSTGNTDQFGITTRGGVSTPGPSLGNQDAINAAYAARPSGPMPQFGSSGGNGEPVRIHGGTRTLGEIFHSDGDAGNRAKFEAYQQRRSDRRANAREMRQQQLSRANDNGGHPYEVINPFMNPVAMRAMRMNPALAMEAIQILNQALASRQGMVNGRYATDAEVGLKGILGIADLNLNAANQQAENAHRDRMFDFESSFRNRQADASMRTADANYLQAEAVAEKNRAEAELFKNPEVRRAQELSNAISEAYASGDPRAIDWARQQQEQLFPLTNGSSAASGPAIDGTTPQPSLAPVRPDEYGNVPQELVYNYVRDLQTRGFEGEDLVAEAAKLGISRYQVLQLYNDRPGPIGQAVGSLGEMFGLNPDFSDEIAFFDDLGSIFGKDYGAERNTKPKRPAGHYARPF